MSAPFPNLVSTSQRLNVSTLPRSCCLSLVTTHQHSPLSLTTHLVPARNSQAHTAPAHPRSTRQAAEQPRPHGARTLACPQPSHAASTRRPSQQTQHSPRHALPPRHLSLRASSWPEPTAQSQAARPAPPARRQYRLPALLSSVHSKGIQNPMRRAGDSCPRMQMKKARAYHTCRYCNTQTCCSSTARFVSPPGTRRRWWCQDRRRISLLCTCVSNSIVPCRAVLCCARASQHPACLPACILIDVPAHPASSPTTCKLP